jgi:serine/threonine protein kinase
VLKVLDFGVSKGGFQEDLAEATSLTSTGMLVGSPMYMSPEQVRADKDIDARSDVWSLGVILYELVTGERPFHGATMSALAISIATDRLSPPSVLRPLVPPGLDAAVLRCLEKDSAARFQSVVALSQAIAPFAEPADTGSHVVSVRRLSSPARIAAVAVAAVAVLAWAAFWIGGRSSPYGVSTPAAASSRAAATSDSAAPPFAAMAPLPPVPRPTPSTSAPLAIVQPGVMVPLSVAIPHPARGAPKPTASASEALPKPGASAPCKLVKTVDKAGESHFACRCAICQ